MYSGARARGASRPASQLRGAYKCHAARSSRPSRCLNVKVIYSINDADMNAKLTAGDACTRAVFNGTIGRGLWWAREAGSGNLTQRASDTVIPFSAARNHSYVGRRMVRDVPCDVWASSAPVSYRGQWFAASQLFFWSAAEWSSGATAGLPGQRVPVRAVTVANVSGRAVTYQVDYENFIPLQPSGERFAVEYPLFCPGPLAPGLEPPLPAAPATYSVRTELKDPAALGGAPTLLREFADAATGRVRRDALVVPPGGAGAGSGSVYLAQLADTRARTETTELFGTAAAGGGAGDECSVEGYGSMGASGESMLASQCAQLPLRPVDPHAVWWLEPSELAAALNASGWVQPSALPIPPPLCLLLPLPPHHICFSPPASLPDGPLAHPPPLSAPVRRPAGPPPTLRTGPTPA
jgi:hypothetical protein